MTKSPTTIIFEPVTPSFRTGDQRTERQRRSDTRLGLWILFSTVVAFVCGFVLGRLT